MNSYHHHHHDGCHHPHITTTTSLPCSYMYVLCYRQDQSNKFNLESPFVWNSNLADSSPLLHGYKSFSCSERATKHCFIHSLSEYLGIYWVCKERQRKWKWPRRAKKKYCRSTSAAGSLPGAQTRVLPCSWAWHTWWSTIIKLIWAT